MFEYRLAQRQLLDIRILSQLAPEPERPARDTFDDQSEIQRIETIDTERINYECNKMLKNRIRALRCARGSVDGMRRFR
jgi:hypothetical protein